MRWIRSVAPFVLALPSAAFAYDFSVDPASPEVSQLRYEARDVVLQDGAGVHIAGSLLGLGADELDGFSYGKDILRPLGPNYFVSLQYSVSRATTGGGQIVTKQATGNGAAGDKFAILILRNGRTVGPFLQSDAPSHRLTPLPPLESEIDGLSFPAGTVKGVYYTVGRGGVKSPSDVWFVAEPGITAPVLWATAAQLGLVAGDNVDCIAIKDGGTVGALDAMDVVNVSLDTASPTRLGPISGGADNILQVWPTPMAVAIPFNKLDITSAATEEIDACTAYDPGTERGGGGGSQTGVEPAQAEVVTAQGTGFGLLSGEIDAAPGANGFYAGVYTATIDSSAYYTTIDFGLRLAPITRFDFDLKYLPDSDEHVVKGGLFAWDRGTSLIDTTTGDQEFHYFAWLGAGVTDTTVIKTGDPIPGVPGQTMQGFNRCGASAIGMRPCFHATLFSTTFQRYWSAVCRDGTGQWTQGATFLTQGQVVNGKTLSNLNFVDCATDLVNPNLTSCYGTATTSTGESVMVRVDATATTGAPIWGAPGIVLDGTRSAPGGGFFNSYGFNTAAGSVVFRGRTTLGGDGIYRFENGAVTKIVDKTTPVPGGSGLFASFGDDLSNDDGATTFIGFSAGGKGIYTNLTGRLQKVVQVNDVIGGRTVQNVTLARDAASMSVVAFGARFNDGWESVVVKEFPVPFDTTNATQRAVHVDVELDPDPALLGPDPRALLAGDLGTARLRGIWTSNGATGLIRIPGSEVARVVALQFGASPSGPFPEWVITVDVATGAVVSSKASGPLANGPFGYDGDTNGGPWTSPLLGAIPGTNAGFETDGAGQKRFCSNAFSSLGGGACGAGVFGFPAPAAYDRATGFLHSTGPVTLGNVVLWGFLGDQRWLEQTPGGCPDIDSDGVCDDADNCAFELNPGQQDAGGVGSGSAPDGIGDACQCADHDGNGVVTLADAVRLQRSFLNPPTATRNPALCDVGASAGCSLPDAVLLRRALITPPAASISQLCDAALP